MKFTLATICLLFAACTTSTPTTPVVPATTPTPSPSVACNLEQTLAGAMANGVASALGCTGTVQIQADLLAAAGKANLCSTAMKGILGNVACPLIVSQVSAVALSKVPSAWGCTGGVTVQQISDKLTSLCETSVKF